MNPFQIRAPGVPKKAPRNKNPKLKQVSTNNPSSFSILAVGPVINTYPRAKSDCIRNVLNRTFRDQYRFREENIIETEYSSNYALYKMEMDDLQKVLSSGLIINNDDNKLIFSMADERSYAYISEFFNDFVNHYCDMIFVDYIKLSNRFNSFVLDLSKSKLDLFSQIISDECGILLGFDNSSILQFLLFNFSLYCTKNKYYIRTLILDDVGITTLDAFNQLSNYFPGIEVLSIKGSVLKPYQHPGAVEAQNHIKIFSNGFKKQENNTCKEEEEEEIVSPSTINEIQITDDFIVDFLTRAQDSIDNLKDLYSETSIFSITVDISYNPEDPLFYYQQYASDLMSCNANNKYWSGSRNIISAQNEIFSSGVISTGYIVQWNGVIPLSFSKQKIVDSYFSVVLTGAFQDPRGYYIGFARSFVIQQNMNCNLIMNDHIHFYNVKG